MHSMFWDIWSKVSVFGFALAIVLAIVARLLFVSKKKTDVEIGRKIISSVGGARNARVAGEEFELRKSSLK